jgi:hypothetical protein
MKAQTIINLVLTTVIIILLFYIRSSADQPYEYPTLRLDSPLVPDCRFNSIDGYAEARNIDRGSAKTATGEFASFASRQGQTVTGGIISKAVIDSLFCSGNFNGLAYQMAMDQSGRVGPANAIFLILGGVNVQNVNGEMRINSPSESVYASNTCCPPGCLSLQ